MLFARAVRLHVQANSQSPSTVSSRREAIAANLWVQLAEDPRDGAVAFNIEACGEPSVIGAYIANGIEGGRIMYVKKDGQHICVCRRKYFGAWLIIDLSAYHLSAPGRILYVSASITGAWRTGAVRLLEGIGSRHAGGQLPAPTLVRGPDYPGSVVAPEWLEGRATFRGEEGARLLGADDDEELLGGSEAELQGAIAARQAQWRHVLFLGLTNFLGAPVTFCLADTIGTPVLLGLLVGQSLASSLLQLWSMRKLEQEVLASPRCHANVIAALRSMHGPFVLGGGICMSAIQHWVLHILLTMPEYLDPYIDAVMAGTAESIMTERMQLAFARSFESKPFGGKVVELGLPGCLRAAFVFATSIQLLHFTITMLVVRKFLDGCDFWGTLASAAELSSLGLLTDLGDRAGEFAHAGSSVWAAWAKVISKGVFEACPSIWLQATLLSLTIVSEDPDRLDIAVNAFSLCTSLLTLTVAAHRFYKVILRLGPFTFVCCVAGGLLPILCVLVVSLVHAGGMWICPKGYWSIVYASCEQWNVTVLEHSNCSGASE